MKCKSCGGELLPRNGIYLCNSCGATFALDSIYENIDVCICYEENDAAGRRTRDSIIAQEVYRKLEEGKVATFYERISADGMTGNDLETGKLAAIHRAKVIIVLGTSVEHFTAIETKYSEHFSGKPVIPFCVDVNPGAIPKTLSKIQAMSYSTIGWDKDLIKGVYNILGREQLVDTGSLYGRRNVNFLIVGIIAAIIAVAGGIAAWIMLIPKDVVKNSETTNETTNETTTLAIGEPTETAKPLSQKEIYNNASELMEQGSYVEALELFSLIPDHPNSANMIQLIYSKYEGYYQYENTGLHIDVWDNVRVDLEVTARDGEKLVKIKESAIFSQNSITCDYLDNHQNSGKLELVLEDTGIRFIWEPASQEQLEIFFALSEKSDEPMLQIDSEQLLFWLGNKYTYSQIIALGYEIEEVSQIDKHGWNRLCKLKDTEIYLSMFGFYYTDDGEVDASADRQLLGFTAPAALVAPELIGKQCQAVLKDGMIYCPKGYLSGENVYIDFDTYYLDTSETIVSESTPIGITIETILSKDYWKQLTDAL